ncbi:hypothetical protein Tco_1576356 [Tanacetum coccineum]
MVVTRNTSLESHVDDSVKNWVTEHEGRGEGTSRFTRLGKLEFPKFFGDDVKGWLYRVKQFFAVDNVHEEEKVKIASIHLHDKALTWHLQFIKMQGENVAWTVYE